MAAGDRPFYWRLCMQIIRISRTIPVIIVLGIVVFGYYVYVFQTVPALTGEWFIRAAIYVILHVLLLLFLASYFATIFAPVPKIPQKYYLPDEVLRNFIETKSDRERNTILYRYAAQNDILVQNVSSNDGPRFCSQCRCIKPDRSHHCSMCSTCVLRYDHHCPWVNNCIHFANYKSFLLFMFYGLVLCLFVLATSLPSFIIFWEGKPVMSQELLGKFSMVFLPFIAFLFGLSLACLFFYHIYLVCRNRTTIEQWMPPTFEHGPDKNAYNLGCAKNFKQIFGESKLYWPFPVFTTSGNGLSYNLQQRRIESLRLLDGESDDEESVYDQRMMVSV